MSANERDLIVGGQAVIEGVMMRTPNAYAIAVRKADGLRHQSFSATCKLLRGRRGLAGGGGCRLGLLAVALVEAVNTSGGVDELLLAGEERVAGRADFKVQLVLARRARLEGVAAGAGDCDLFVFGMNSLLHFYSSSDGEQSGPGLKRR